MSDVSSKHKPNEYRSWGPLQTAFLTVLIFVLSYFLAGVLFSIIASVYKSSDFWLQSNTAQFMLVLLFEGATVGLLWFFLRLKQIPVKLLGFMRGPEWRDLGYSLVGFAAYFGLLIVVSQVATDLLPINVDQKQEIAFTPTFELGQLVMVFVSLAILPPIAEELLFRGFLFGGLRAKLRFWQAALFTSIFFGALHLFTGIQGEGLLWIAGIDTFVLSLVLCYAREKTGALWACIGIHAIKNGLAFLYIFVVQ